jgi:FkbM family methyltransferase
MAVNVDRIAANPVGRIAYYLARPLVIAFRRTANPGIPTSHIISTVRCGDRKISLEHRRWSQGDATAIKQCFVEQQYNMPTGAQGATVARMYRNILASGRQPIILDCGANIGASVAWFAARYPEAHIIAVEPAPANFALLEKNAAGLDVELHMAGIGPHDGHAFLKDCGSDMGYQTTSEGEGIAIEMVSVASLLASRPASRYTPFLLKVDIEGAERPLFAGDTSAIKRFPLIILEPHDWLLPGQLTSRPFFEFHVAAGREFAVNNENIASIALQPQPEPSESPAQFVH